MINNKFIDSLSNLDCNIVCVTKSADVAQMKELHELGYNTFAESYVNPFLEKYEEFKSNDVKWHFIGHLQTNKVKKIVNKIDCLHSLDSLNLAKYINKYRDLPLDCFIEININDEDSKTGINESNVIEFLESLKEYPKVNPIGLMAIGVNNDLGKTELGFKKILNLKDKLCKLGYNINNLSMGMSDDYMLALEYGSTHIRLGRILFKEI